MVDHDPYLIDSWEFSHLMLYNNYCSIVTNDHIAMSNMPSGHVITNSLHHHDQIHKKPSSISANLLFQYHDHVTLEEEQEREEQEELCNFSDPTTLATNWLW